MWSNLHSHEGSIEYFSSKKRLMHCLGEAEKTQWGNVRKRNTISNEGNIYLLRWCLCLTFNDINACSLWWVLLGVVGGGEQASLSFLYPGATLAYWSHP
jgi:hypothetical protein